MKAAFVSASYQAKAQLAPELAAIARTLKGLNITPTIFVNEYEFAAEQEQEMMSTVFAIIRQVDFLVAEVSYKGIGIGIEVGYAVALGKPVIYLRQTEAAYSTTVGGVAAHTLVYANRADLQQKLAAAVLGLSQS